MMDMLLAVVTALSLAMAIAMGALIWRMVREDRRRSDARVAALVELTQSRAELTQPRADVLRADVRRADVPRAELTRSRADVPSADGSQSDGAPEPVALEPVAREQIAPEHAARSTSHVARRTSHVARSTSSVVPETAFVTGLFTEPERSSPWAARLLVVAGLVLIVSSAGFFLLSPASTGAREAGAANVARASAGEPLELLTLKHSQSAEALTVTGLVQNPRSSAPMARVVVTALAFAADGALLASGRAPLDYTTLAPGDESPFVVTVPVRGRVARYRIGFRSEDGSVIAHLDKRQADAVAMK